MESLVQWNEAIAAANAKNFPLALEKMLEVKNPPAYVQYNLGALYDQRNETDKALQYFKNAVDKDNYFTLGYFRIGCVYYKTKIYSEAIKFFEKCEHCCRGVHINYEPLGLSCRLYRCEILYNMALSHGRNGNIATAIQLLLRAKEEKQMRGHDVIDKALNSLNSLNNLSNSSDRLDFSRFQMISVTGEMLFRPTKQTPSKKIDFLSSAEVLVSHNPEDKFIGFRGLQQKTGSAPDITAIRSSSAANSTNDLTSVIPKATTSPPATPPPRRQQTPAKAPVLYNLDSSNVGPPPGIPPPRAVAHN